jgi:hypothetical protein
MHTQFPQILRYSDLLPTEQMIEPFDIENCYASLTRGSDPDGAVCNSNLNITEAELYDIAL